MQIITVVQILSEGHHLNTENQYLLTNHFLLNIQILVNEKKESVTTDHCDEVLSIKLVSKFEKHVPRHEVQLLNMEKALQHIKAVLLHFDQTALSKLKQEHV